MILRLARGRLLRKERRMGTGAVTHLDDSTPSPSREPVIYLVDVEPTEIEGTLTHEHLHIVLFDLGLREDEHALLDALSTGRLGKHGLGAWRCSHLSTSSRSTERSARRSR